MMKDLITVSKAIDYDELKLKETRALKFIAYYFLMTSFWLAYILIYKWSSLSIEKNKFLFFIHVCNLIGFFFCSIYSFVLVSRIKLIKLLVDLEKIKKGYYRSYLLFVGIPFLSMTLWLFLNHDLPSSLLLFTIFFLSAIALVFDWREFLSFKKLHKA
jgi:hypothetical protein